MNAIQRIIVIPQVRHHNGRPLTADEAFWSLAVMGGTIYLAIAFLVLLELRWTRDWRKYPALAAATVWPLLILYWTAQWLWKEDHE